MTTVTQRAAFADLLARDDVCEQLHMGSTFGFMAFHGGLEAGTEDLAAAAAHRAGASLYTVVQPADLRWHVPSHRVNAEDSEALGTFLTHVDVVIALHGYGRMDRKGQVLLGGSNRVLAARLAAALSPALPECTVVDELDAIPAELRGLHPANPVNRVALGGVQIELPPRARSGADVVAALAGVAAGWGCDD